MLDKTNTLKLQGCDGNMRNPNGYGAIINLGKNRRKPWAIRVTTGFKDAKQKYKYLSYHEKRQDAIMALADYNSNPYDLEANKSTFKDVYELWMVKALEDLAKTSRNTYTNAYNHCKPIHDDILKKKPLDYEWFSLCL